VNVDEQKLQEHGFFKSLHQANLKMKDLKALTIKWLAQAADDMIANASDIASKHQPGVLQMSLALVAEAESSLTQINSLTIDRLMNINEVKSYCLRESGNFEAALEVYNSIFQFSSKLARPLNQDQSYYLNNHFKDCSKCYEGLGLFIEALFYLKEQEKYIEEDLDAHRPIESLCKQKMANAYFHLKCYEKAYSLAIESNGKITIPQWTFLPQKSSRAHREVMVKKSS